MTSCVTEWIRPSSLQGRVEAEIARCSRRKELGRLATNSVTIRYYCDGTPPPSALGDYRQFIQETNTHLNVEVKAQRMSCAGSNCFVAFWNWSHPAHEIAITITRPKRDLLFEPR